MCGPRLLKTGWAPGVEKACYVQSLGGGCQPASRGGHRWCKGILQRLCFLSLKIDLVWEVTQTSKCLRVKLSVFLCVAGKNALAPFRVSQPWHRRHLEQKDFLPWWPSRVFRTFSSIPGLDPLNASISPLDPQLVIIRQRQTAKFSLRSSRFLIILPQNGNKHNLLR